MKKILLSILCLMLTAINIQAQTTVTGVAADKYGSATITIEEDFVVGDVTLSVAKGEGSSTAPAFNKAGDIRAYALNVITVSCSNGNLTEIVFNISAQGLKRLTDLTPSTGSTAIDAENAKVVWTGNASEVSLTVGEKAVYGTDGASKAGQICFKSFTATYGGAVSSSTLSKPVTSVEPGTIYNTTTVELSSESEGAIYYTTDGTEPTAESAAYSEAIAISEFGTTTIKAIVINGEEKSDVATFSYSLRVADPVFSVDGGVYEKLSGANALTFSTETNGATILYNNRGGDPRTEGSKTWGSLSVLSTAVVQAVAFVTNAEGDTIFSNVVKEYYTISPVKPFKVATEIVSGTKYLITANNLVAEPLYESYTYGDLFTNELPSNGDFIETFEHYGFTITETETAGEYTIQDAYNRYLYMSKTYNNFNVATDLAELGDSAIWTISIEDDCTATITNKEKGKYIQLYTSSKGYTNFGSFNEEKEGMPILYAMREYPTLTITPANWETVESITKVVVTCEDGIALNESEELYATYRDPDWNMGLDFGYGKVSEDGKSVVYELETPLTANGDYMITFPAGLFTLDPNGLAVASEQESLGLTVDNPNVLELVYANPDGESNVKSIEYLYFEFSQNIFDSVNGAAITDANGKEYPLSVTYTDAWGGSTPYNALCLKTAEPITEPGTYTFVLKKEYIYAGENVRIADDITYTFTIAEGLKITKITPANEAEVSEVSEIIIDFNNYVYHDYVSSIWVMDENGTEYEFVKDAENLEYNTMIIKFIAATPITAVGTYMFTLEEYAVYGYDSSWNMETIPTQSFSFVITDNATGIEETVAEEGEKTIFDLTGRRVKEINKAGIYIINGVKTVVE